MRLALAAALLVLLVAGCRTTRPPDPAGSAPAPPPEEVETNVRGDVMVDGTSVLGAWYAVEVVGNAEATRDLADGTLEQTLIVSPNGRAVLTGVDHREGGQPVAFGGRIAGNRVTFIGMEGAGLLVMTGRRLILRDPTGRSTVFVRGSGRGEGGR